MIKKLTILLLVLPLFVGAQTLVHPSRISTTTGTTGQILKINSSGVYAPAADATGGGGGTGSNWTFVSDQLSITPSTTVGIIVNYASSTIFGLNSTLSTTTRATTTYLSVSNNAVLSSSSAGILNVGNLTATSSFTCTACIDISGETNLAVTYPVILTDDTLSLAFGTTTANSWSAIQTISGALIGSSTIGTLTASSSLTVPSLTSALILTDSAGLFGEYTGVTCTNQFLRILSAAGAGTCATVTSSDVDSTITPSSRTLTIAGTANQITSSAGAQDLTANRTWTLSFPDRIIFPDTFSSNSGTSTLFQSASSSIGNLIGGTITASSTLTVLNLTSAITLTGSGGLFAEYTGTSCTNQFVRSLDALGVSTCATVVAGDVDLADLTATNGTLTFSGTYDGQTARTIGLNLGNANTWTALQIFNASVGIGTSTFSGYNLAVGGGAIIGGNLMATGTIKTGVGANEGVVSYDTAFSINYTTTTWSGTTTRYAGLSPWPLTIRTAQCDTNAGTLGISLYDSSNRADFITASTTNGITTYTTNNTFTKGETIRVDIGTPASSPTIIECTFNAVKTSNN